MLKFALLVDLQESYGLARPVVQQMSLKEEPDLYLETRISSDVTIDSFIVLE